MKNIFQIVGYQNSGKTTLMEKLIKEAAAQGRKVASIKHHGHGGTPDQKDSHRHQKAGAVVAGVEGAGILQLNMQQEKWTLSQVLEVYQLFPVDCLFIEGYKQAPYPKAVLVRHEKDLKLLELDNIQCVITWGPAPSCSVPVFHVKQEEKYLAFILTEMLEAGL